MAANERYQSIVDDYEGRMARTLVEKGYLSQEQLEEVLAFQVVVGNYLTTNLWDLGMVSNADAKRCAAEILKLRYFGESDMAAIDFTLAKVLPRELAQKYHVIPVELDQKHITLATCEPWDILVTDDLRFRLGKEIRTVFVTEVDIARALHRYFSFPLMARVQLGPQVKTAPMAVRTEAWVTDDAQIEKSTQQGADAFSLFGAPGGDSGNLSGISTEDVDPGLLPQEFQGAVQQAAKPAATPIIELDMDEPSEAAFAAPQAVTPAQAAHAEQVARISQPAVPPPQAAQAPTPWPAPQELSIDDIVVPPPTVTPSAAPVMELQLDDIQLPPPLQPIANAQEAYAFLESAQSREALGETLVRFALSKGKRVVLLVRQGHLWTGWFGAGLGMNPALVPQLVVEPAKGTMFGMVADTGSYFLGPVAKQDTYDNFYSALGVDAPKTASLFPVHYRGKIAFGIYLDGGPGKVMRPDFGDILIMAQRVPVSLERLVRQRLRR